MSDVNAAAERKIAADLTLERMASSVENLTKLVDLCDQYRDQPRVLDMMVQRVIGWADMLKVYAEGLLSAAAVNDMEY